GCNVGDHRLRGEEDAGGVLQAQFAALGSSSGSSPMMNVSPLELPSAAWVACAPLTFDWMMALRINDVPAVPATGVARERVLADPGVGPRALPAVTMGGKVSPGASTRSPKPIQGPAQPL